MNTYDPLPSDIGSVELAEGTEGQIQKLAAAIRNDIVSGLRGYHHNMSMSLELLEDEVVLERLAVIKEYQLKGILPINDLLQSINCIPVDCKDLDKCKCSKEIVGTPIAHFEIPQLLLDFGDATIKYIGSTDRQNPFTVYTDVYVWNYYHKYRKRGKQKPFVYVDIVPNEHGMVDCYIFNAPMMEMVSVSAIFKDPRLVELFDCCRGVKDNNSFLTLAIQERLTTRKIKYYRQLAAQIFPNDQVYAQG